MSALDGWIDICRAGTWRDLHGREAVLSAAQLARIAQAYAAGDPAPVVVGHPKTDAPAYGWVAALRRVGDRLQARLRDLAPAFRRAVEEGRYAARSIALSGDRLVHLGFLGGAAPAVPGLAPTQFALPADRVIALSAAEAARERASNDSDESDEKSDEKETAMSGTTTETGEGDGERDAGALAAAHAALDAERAALEEARAALAAREARLAADERQRLAEAALAARVRYDEIAGGPAPAAGPAAHGEDDAAVAADARALMASRAEAGIVLSAAEAVDRVRARRGLPGPAQGAGQAPGAAA